MARPDPDAAAQVVHDGRSLARRGARIAHETPSQDQEGAVDLNEVVALVELRVAALLTAVRGTIEADELPRIRMSRGVAEELFFQAIGNAIKFREGDPPHVRIAYRQEAGRSLLDIHDNGAGIALVRYRSLLSGEDVKIEARVGRDGAMLVRLDLTKVVVSLDPRTGRRDAKRVGAQQVEP